MTSAKSTATAEPLAEIGGGPINLDELRAELKTTAPGQFWADGVACEHGTVKRDCEWCSPKSASELIDSDKSARTRADLIRDLYALAEFYTANPDIPLPYQIYVFVHAKPEQVEEIAKAHGTRQYGPRNQTDIRVAGMSVPTSILVSPRLDSPL